MNASGRVGTGLWVPGLLLFLQVFARSGESSLRNGLFLRNGDLLSGDPVSVSRDRMGVQPYWSGDGVELPFNRLSHMRQPGPRGDLPESYSILHLKSGDRLPVRELSGREGWLQVTTLWEQSLAVRMEELRAIRFYEREHLLPQTASNRASVPSFAGGFKLTAGGALYQTVPITFRDSFLLEMEVRVPDEDYQLQVRLFDDGEQRNPARIVLEISGRRIYAAWFARVLNKGFSLDSWQEENPVEGSHGHLRLFGDMEKNQYTLYLNEQLIKTWEVEHTGTLVRGSSAPIQIRATSGTEPVWLNALRVLRWRGQPVPPGYLSSANHEEALMILANGDRLRGTVHEIGAGSIRFQPLDRTEAVSYDRSEVFELVYPDSNTKTPPKSPRNLIKLRTNLSGERLRTEPVAIENGVLRGRTAWADAELEIPLARIRLFDFQTGLKAAPTEVDALSAPHHLRLLNGDQLTGAYLGQDGEDLLFQPIWQKTPLRIHGKYVSRLRLGNREPPKGGGWNFTLANGDTLSGRIRAKTETELVLETTWSDFLRVRLTQVRGLRRRVPGEQLKERGPSSMDDWVYLNGTGPQLSGDQPGFTATGEGWFLTQRGMVQKRLPDVQNSFRFSVQIRAPQTESMIGGVGITLTAMPNAEGGYRMLQVTQRRDQYILNVTDPRRTGSLQVPLSSVEPDANGEIRWEFEFDHNRKTLQIRANGELAHEWMDPEATFTAERYSPMITFSVNGRDDAQVLIREWRLYDLREAFASPRDSESAGGAPRVWLSNGDQLEAAWNGLTDQRHWLLTPAGSNEAFTLEPNRIHGFDFETAEEESIKRRADHIRLVLNGGTEQFIAEMISADRDRIYIRREGWSGNWNIPMEQVERIEFNPYWTWEHPMMFPPDSVKFR